jgi:predicted DNA repair protein MutK
MRILQVVTGIAVVLTSLHFGHAIHHFLTQASPEDLHSPAIWAAVIAAIIVAILSLIGGVLLVARKR